MMLILYGVPMTDKLRKAGFVAGDEQAAEVRILWVDAPKFPDKEAAGRVAYRAYQAGVPSTQAVTVTMIQGDSTKEDFQSARDANEALYDLT